MSSNHVSFSLISQDSALEMGGTGFFYILENNFSKGSTLKTKTLFNDPNWPTNKCDILQS